MTAGFSRPGAVQLCRLVSSASLQNRMKDLEVSKELIVVLAVKTKHMATQSTRPATRQGASTPDLVVDTSPSKGLSQQSQVHIEHSAEGLFEVSRSHIHRDGVPCSLRLCSRQAENVGTMSRHGVVRRQMHNLMRVAGLPHRLEIQCHSWSCQDGPVEPSKPQVHMVITMTTTGKIVDMKPCPRRCNTCTTPR